MPTKDPTEQKQAVRPSVPLLEDPALNKESETQPPFGPCPICHKPTGRNQALGECPYLIDGTY